MEKDTSNRKLVPGPERVYCESCKLWILPGGHWDRHVMRWHENPGPGGKQLVENLDPSHWVNL